MAGSCEGLVALVTGASQGGTGTAIAERLAAEGARVAIVARNEEGLARTLDLIRDAGSTGIARRCDLSDPDGGREELGAWVEGELGPVDILVNNAAMGGYKPFVEWKRTQLLRMAEVNIWAPWSLAQQVLGGMRERGRGWILNVTSRSSRIPDGPPYLNYPPVRFGTAYGGTKAALDRWTVSLAAETHGQGVAVNALYPNSAIATPQLVAADWIPKETFEPLETMTEAALALCSGDPDTLTGRIAGSLALLVELGRPVHDLRGRELLAGWQPADIPTHMERSAKARDAWTWSADGG